MCEGCLFWPPWLQERCVKRFTQIFRELLIDDCGGETLEYAIIAGLIVVAALSLIRMVGTKVLARWTSLNSSV